MICMDLKVLIRSIPNVVNRLHVGEINVVALLVVRDALFQRVFSVIVNVYQFRELGRAVFDMEFTHLAINAISVLGHFLVITN